MFNKIRNGAIQTKKQMWYFNKGNLCDYSWHKCFYPILKRMKNILIDRNFRWEGIRKSVREYI